MLKKSLPILRKEAVDSLMKSADSMTGKNAVNRFVKGLLTEHEQVVIGRRIQIAQMIISGKTRMEIGNKLGVSPNTIAHTRQWLDKEIPEYGKSLQKYKTTNDARRARKGRSVGDHSTPFTLADLRRRYPAHFLLLNLAEEIFRK